MLDSGALCLAIDLGGTTLLIGAIDRKGIIVQSKTYKTGYREQQDAAQAIMKGIEDFLSEASGIKDSLVATGLGVVGQVDPSKGEWHSMYSEGYSQIIPLAEWIMDKYGLPCSVDNDVKAATAAERVFGIGTTCSNFAYVNIGTGIAAGFVVDGNLLRGQNNNAGEIGHMVVDLHSDVACSCGNFGCVEAIASGRGMQLRCKQLAHEYRNSKLAEIIEGEVFQLGSIFALADAGDELAKRIAYDAVAAASAMVNNIRASLNPDKIIFGGGVVVDGWMLERIRLRLPRGVNATDIEISTLDPRTVGLIGASVIGFGGLAET